MSTVDRKIIKRSPSPIANDHHCYHNTETNEHLNFQSHNKRILPTLVHSKFPEDFFSSMKDLPEGSSRLNKKNINKHLKFDSEIIIRSTCIPKKKIDNVKQQQQHQPQIQQQKGIQLKNNNQSPNKTIAHRCVCIDIDDEYEDDKRLIELLEGNKPTQENKETGDELIQSLKQNKKQPKCEIIPEVDESKFKKTIISIINPDIQQNYNSKDSFTYLNNNDSFIKDNYTQPLIKKPFNLPKANTPLIHLPSLNSKLSIDGLAEDNSNNRDKDRDRDRDRERDNEINSNKAQKNSSRDRDDSNPVNSNLQTESSSSRSNRSNSSAVRKMSPISIHRQLQTDIDQLIYQMDEYKEDPVIKEKLNRIMKNITEIKSAIANKNKNRSNLVSAPTITSKHCSMIQNDAAIHDFTRNNEVIKGRLEVIKKDYLQDHFKIVHMSQRRKQTTAPIKLFNIHN